MSVCLRLASRCAHLPVAILALCALTLPASAQVAGEGIPDPSIATSLPPELADPGGVRAVLARRGVTFGINYIGEVFGTASGGFERRGYYDGRLEVAVSADLERLLGWRGLSFFANGYQIHGESITGDSLGVLMTTTSLEAAPATRMLELWFEQRLMDDRMSVRFGQQAVDSEFILSEGGMAFVNATWGWASISAVDTIKGGPAYPLSAPGVRVAFDPNEHLRLMAGVFNGDPAPDCAPDEDPQACNAHGLEFPVDGPALWMFEGAYRYTLGGLPGTVKLGGWLQEGEFAHLHTGAILDGAHGLYAILDQMIYKSGEGGGISVFARVIGAPEDRSPADIYWEGGVTFSGLIPSRPDDVLGIGFARTGLSDDASAAQVDSGETVIMDYEALLEVSYRAQIVPGFFIQPDFQYFWHPGGNVADPNDPNRAVKDAAVLGVRSIINY